MYVKSWCPEDNTMQMFQSDKVDEKEESNLEGTEKVPIDSF